MYIRYTILSTIRHRSARCASPSELFWKSTLHITHLPLNISRNWPPTFCPSTIIGYGFYIPSDFFFFFIFEKSTFYGNKSRRHKLFHPQDFHIFVSDFLSPPPPSQTHTHIHTRIWPKSTSKLPYIFLTQLYWRINVGTFVRIYDNYSSG